MGKGFEDFEPIFGRINAEWEENNNSINSSSMLPFIFHVHGLDASVLRIHVTDFHSYSWESTRSIIQLEDLRDEIGLSGSWHEFVAYLTTSFKSGEVKLVINGLLATKGSADDDGITFAKLIAQKSKGMPRVTISLQRLMNSSVNDAIANLSMELFKAFKSNHALVVREQERCYQLTERLSAEKEKSEAIQNQLDAALFSKKRRSSNMSAKALPFAIPIGSLDVLPTSESLDSSRNPPIEAPPVSTKFSQRVVPAYRRWDYIQEGNMIYKDIDRLVLVEKGLTTWSKWVDSNIDTSKTQVFYLGISPAHFFGREWGSPRETCVNQTTPFQGTIYPGGEDTGVTIVKKVLNKMSKLVKLLDVTTLSQFRKDGHPSKYATKDQTGLDCSHWCVGGVPDTWNELFYAWIVNP